MKKIYLDWNIINHIDEIPGLYDFILNNQNHFVFVYSPAHFSDLMRSVKGDNYNEFFEKDIERLGRICETHLMKYSDNKMNLHRCPPSEFLEKEGKDYPVFSNLFNLGFYKDSLVVEEIDLIGVLSESLKAIEFGKIELPLIGSFSNGLEFFQCLLGFLDGVFTDEKETKKLKSKIIESVPEKEIAQISNSTPQMVIDTINSFFEKNGIKEGLKEIIANGISDEQKGNDMLVFQALYLSLDFIKYYSDKRNLWNIITDAEHAYYGSYCDALVTGDDRMMHKTEAVYSYCGITTEIVSKQDVLKYLKNTIASENSIEEPLKEVLYDQHIPTEFEEDSVYCKWTRLDNPVWGYFNKLEYFLNLSTKQNWLTLSRERKFEKCIFFTETDKFFEVMKTVLQKPEIIEAFTTEFVEKYKANDSSALFGFYLSNDVQVTLSVTKEDNMLVPVMDLVYYGKDNALSA